MTDHDDGESDDPQLQSLRAVWLAMPDQDPPQRGLAELMAAARVKAEEMATPSLWQRISTLLLRPPVLAFATVLVIAGGAVFIGQRSDTMQAEPTVSIEQASEPSTTQPPAVGAPAGPAQGSAAASAAAETIAEPMIPEPRFEPSPEPSSDPSLDRSRESEKRDDVAPAITRRPAPAKQADVETAKPMPRPDRHRLAEDKGARDDAAGEDSGIRRGLVKPADKALSTASEGGAAPSAPAAEMAAEMAAEPRAGAMAPAPRTTAQPPASSTANALAQARAAASRGDCAAAQKLMKRVAREDAAAYRKALASHAALERCVAGAK